MKVTVHITSYESGFVRICEHAASIKAAKALFYNLFRECVLTSDDAVMSVYPYTPQDNSMMSHNDYPMFNYVVGRAGSLVRRPV